MLVCVTCYKINHFAAIKPYDKLCDRQKLRRKKEIGDALQNYLEGLEQQAGLKPISVEFKSTTDHSLISLPLNSAATTTESTGHKDHESSTSMCTISTEPTGHEDPPNNTSTIGHEDPLNSAGSSTMSHDDSNDNLTEGILYLLMKHNVSIQFYHDLSRLSDHSDLPRSYKVSSLR